MVLRFNADEILQMAMQIERNGSSFYRKVADLNPDGRDLLLKLAKQEDEHLATFESIQRELSGEEKRDTVFDPDGDSAIYLRAMADSHVFEPGNPEAEKALSQGADLKVIIDTALQAEKDTIAFFAGMRSAVPERLGRDRIDQLIREEMRHIRWLTERR